MSIIKLRAVIAALALKKIKIYIHIYTVISLLRPPFLLNYMLLPKREGLLEGGGGLLEGGSLKERERGGGLIEKLRYIQMILRNFEN